MLRAARYHCIWIPLAPRFWDVDSRHPGFPKDSSLAVSSPVSRALFVVPGFVSVAELLQRGCVLSWVWTPSCQSRHSKRLLVTFTSSTILNMASKKSQSLHCVPVLFLEAWQSSACVKTSFTTYSNLPPPDSSNLMKDCPEHRCALGLPAKSMTRKNIWLIACALQILPLDLRSHPLSSTMKEFVFPSKCCPFHAQTPATLCMCSWRLLSCNAPSFPTHHPHLSPQSQSSSQARGSSCLTSHCLCPAHPPHSPSILSPQNGNCFGLPCPNPH